MNLRGRLKLIADMIPNCNTACDIGTDHAYIPIYLVATNVCKRVIATDIRKGPVLIAEDNVDRFDFGDCIETRLGDGLQCIQEGEAECIIIAGMGGALIRDILAEGLDKARRADTLILQPMNAIEALREWLYANGFYIYDEGLINEGEKIYNAIAARWDGCSRETDKISCYIGEKLVEKRDPLLPKYINKRLMQFETIISELEKRDEQNDEIERMHKWMRDGLLDILEKFK